MFVTIYLYKNVMKLPRRNPGKSHCYRVLFITQHSNVHVKYEVIGNDIPE